MAKKTFTVTLSDGSVISDLQLNGNNFISSAPISASTFDGKLAHVTISGNPEFDDFGLIGEHENMELIQCKQYGDEYWFILRDMPPEALWQLRTEARLDYIEMMEDL